MRSLFSVCSFVSSAFFSRKILFDFLHGVRLFYYRKTDRPFLKKHHFCPYFRKKISWKLVDDSTQSFIFQPMQG